MVTPPTPDAVTTFMRITGASEFVAVQKLEEFGGNLNEAVNAHFIEGDRDIQRQNIAAAPEYDFAGVNNQSHVGSRGISPFLSAARRFRPSLLLDPNYRRELRELYNGIRTDAFPNRAPYTSHPEEAREVPMGFDSAFHQCHQSGLSSTSADMTGNSLSYGRGTHETDDYQNVYRSVQSNTSHVPVNDMEEEMIQAAIEASKQDSSDSGFPQNEFHQEDEDLARAISLSLKMAKQEKAIREHLVKEEKEGLGVCDLSNKGEETNGSRSRIELGMSSNRNATQNAAPPVMDHPLNLNASGHLRGNQDVFNSEEWGGISSDELNEALLLESALFGEIPNHSSHEFSSLPAPQQHSSESGDFSSPKSQSLTAAQLLREQQDADKLKALNALNETEACCLKEKESGEKNLEKEELEKILDKKEVSLPKEPSLDDENAITIIVRLPDGGRHGRRFLRTDKLQLLFDFIDICGAVKPGTYRVVKFYPRCGYSVKDGSLTLNDVGLVNKQEALFLELI